MTARRNQSLGTMSNILQGRPGVLMSRTNISEESHVEITTVFAITPIFRYTPIKSFKDLKRFVEDWKRLVKDVEKDTIVCNCR